VVFWKCGAVAQEPAEWTGQSKGAVNADCPETRWTQPPYTGNADAQSAFMPWNGTDITVTASFSALVLILNEISNEFETEWDCGFRLFYRNHQRYRNVIL
jgi:hypothetical protein